MARTRTHGFWAGFLSGVILAALIGVGLAVLFPRGSEPPELAPAALEAPEAPALPAEAAGEPAAPVPGLVAPRAAAPLIEQPEPDTAPGSAAQSPSLVPLEN